MTSFDLYGIPENPTLASLLPPVAVNFSKLLDGTFAPNGTDGMPDPNTDPLSAFTYMVNKANLITQSAQQRPMMRLADQNLNILAEIVGELSCDTEEVMADTGQARVVITYENYLVDWMVNQIQVYTDVHLIIDPTPTQRTWKTRWGGKVHQINVKRNEDGTSTVEIIALSVREHAKKLLIAANPFFAPEIQLPRIWVLPGPIRTILFATFIINLARLFAPGLSTITNTFNPLSWINPALADQNIIADFDPLSWPIQVAFVDPLLDQSRWTVIGATWTDWHSSTTDMLKDCGVVLRAYTYLAGEDTDSPNTELANLITGNEGLAIDVVNAIGLSSADQLIQAIGTDLVGLTMPTRNCVCFSLEDMSGQAGPTGTALDGLLNLIGVTFDDLFTSVLINADTGQTLAGEPVIDVINPTAPIAEALLGVAPQPPNVIWRESTYDRVVSKQHSLYKAPPLTMMTGGRSPTLVNEAQCVSADTLIDGPDGVERIDILAKRGESFRVWSVTPEGQRVAATALYAFKKGTTELFEYNLDDGRSIKATHQHRFLTNRGFIPGAEIAVGSWIATAPESAPCSDVRMRRVIDSDYECVPETAAVKFRKVVSVVPMGVDDYYDMHVPGWENYSANGFWNHNTFGIQYGLSQLQTVVAAGGGVGGVAVEGGPPIGAGLSSLYQGQLDNSVLAWERITDPTRAVWTGDLAYQEWFERGTQTAYTLAGILTLRQADWNTRAFYGFQAQVISGFPWVLDVDVRLGERAGWEFDGVIYVDQVTAIKRTWDRQNPVLCTISVGDDRDKQDPVARSLRSLNAVYGMFAGLLGEGTLFG
jgi:Intein splicing domain